MKEEEPRRCGRSRTWIRSQWRGHIAAQASSGLSAVAYCEVHGLHPKSFYRWKRVLRESGELGDLLGGAATAMAFSPGPPKPVFAEVRVSGATGPAASGVEVALREGVTVRVSPGFDAETLRRVVSVLEEGRC